MGDISLNGHRTRTANHAGHRWVQTVVAGIESDEDVRTIAILAHVAGRSASTIKAICRAAGVPTKATTDFVRLARAIWLVRDGPWDPYSLLDIVDSRTMARLIRSAGLDGWERPQTGGPGFTFFLERQRMIPQSLVGLFRQGIQEKLRTQGAE